MSLRPLVVLLAAAGLAAADPVLAMTPKEMQAAVDAEGRLVEGSFRSQPVENIQRLKFAVPAGTLLGDDTRCVLEIETAQAAPVALLLVVRKADGGWAGNLQGEQRAGGGRQTLSWRIGDLKLVNGPGPVAGGTVGNVVVMCWDQGTEVRLHRLAIGVGAK